jgi:hypothetical protein
MRTNGTILLVASLALMTAACDSGSKGEAQKPAAAPLAANGAPAPAPKVIPPFPWTILGEVYPDQAAFNAALAANKWSGHAVAINGVTVVTGFGPAFTGTSGTPAPALQRP